MAWGERLGCASSYTVTIHYQGGQRVYAYLDAVERVQWSRERREVSTAEVAVSAQALSADCAALLVDVWPWVHEVTIYRDDRAVWQGPITKRPTQRTSVGGNTTSPTITLHAQDCGVWLERRLLREDRKLTDVDLGEVGRAVVESTLAVRDPGVVGHMVVREVGKTVNHAIHAYGRWGMDELDEVAGQGMDWCFVGRTMFMAAPADENTPPQAQLTGNDLLGEVELELDGENYASMVYAAPQPQDGVWNHLEGVGGASPYFGLVEYVVQTDLAWNLDDDGNFEPPAADDDSLTEQETVEALVRAAQSRHTQISRPPIVVRCSEDARLSPEAPVSMDRLVPGARIDLALDPQDFLFALNRPMRLTRVDVTWDGDGERVGVSLVQIGTSGDNEIEEV